VQRKLALTIALALVAAAPIARGDASYRYEGNAFQTVAGRYTTEDSLSGTIGIPSVLAPNLANAMLTLSDWSFSDGLKVFTPANSTVDFPMVSTDAGGHIVGWSFDFSDGAGEVMGTFDNGPGDQIDQATDFTGGNSLASNQNLPGSWSLVPEPAASVLAWLSLALLAIKAPRSG